MDIIAYTHYIDYHLTLPDDSLLCTSKELAQPPTREYIYQVALDISNPYKEKSLSRFEKMRKSKFIQDTLYSRGYDCIYYSKSNELNENDLDGKEIYLLLPVKYQIVEIRFGIFI